MADFCLVLVYGLPAAGKTTLVQTLVDQMSSQVSEASQDGALCPIVFEYDKLLPAEVEKHLVQTAAENNVLSPWRQYREDIQRCIDTVVSIITVPGTRQPDVYSKLREALPSHINSSLKESLCEIMMRNMSSYGGSWDGRKMCLFIDDNFYYRSMRYSYYQVARKYHIGFCQLYVQTDVDTAISHNAKRKADVPQEIIVTMATKIEAPDMLKNSWEKHSLTLDIGNINMENIFNLITKAMANPVQHVQEVDEDLQNQSREICSASFLYQSDQILRKLVSQQMAAMKETGLSKGGMKSLASILQILRKQILENLKAGTITVPQDVTSTAADSSKDTASLLYEFLHKALSDGLRAHQGQDYTGE